jgi:hypothetical protein
MTAESRHRERCALPVAPDSGSVDDTDPATWPATALAALQAVIDRSRASAGAAVRDTFGRAGRGMTAAEFVSFWNASRLKAMATAAPDGAPHIAPVHAAFVAGRLRTTIYENALRRRDLQANPRVALTTWGPNGAAAIVYGTARELPGSRRETRPGASGRARHTVTLDVTATRIYAMKAREPWVEGAAAARAGAPSVGPPRRRHPARARRSAPPARRGSRR